MRLRHILLACATLPLLTAHSVAGVPKPNSTATDAAEASSLSAKELAEVRSSIRRTIEGIDIPYREFTLPNGLRTLVHTDRNAPTVFVSVTYDVASKHEEPGRSGFAHLFEHLMFNGSENVPGEYMQPLMSVGAEMNGSTTLDRTNYYETVPTPALDRALFMESDRMGHFLGALSQATLDEQRGVVQNEKRSGEGPGTIVEQMERSVLYPKPHPYDHMVIGSMKDLNAATLEDVRAFFKKHYGPNNATLILAGDIDFETAQRLVTKYFAAIPAGPRNVRPILQSQPLAKTVRETVTAPITGPVIIRKWRVPGTYSKEALTLDAVAESMSGTPTAPMVKHLVRDLKLFQMIQASNSTDMHGGTFTISGPVRPGVDAKVAEAALDREIEAYLKRGTSTNALTRWVARYTSKAIKELEFVSARGSQMAEDLTAYGNPLAVKANLLYYADLTPRQVNAAAHRWLAQPRLELTMTPGSRVISGEDAGIDGTTATEPTNVKEVAPVRPHQAPVSTNNRGPLPSVGPVRDSRFPAVEHATLANGIPVLYARAGTTPYTLIGVRIEGGTQAEPVDQTGTMAAMYRLLDDGFGKLDENAIRERKELLSIGLSSSAGSQSGSASLETPDSNLTQGLEMLRQMLTAPTFPVESIDRWQRSAIDGLAAMRLSAAVLSQEALLPLIDAGAPDNRTMMYGNAARVRRTDRNAIVAAFHRWVRPEQAKITVVSTKPLNELLPEMNRTLGTWKATTPFTPPPAIEYRAQPGKPQITLIDLPGEVSATITGGELVPIDDKAPGEALSLASEVLGSGFTSRINMNLREDKHWTYGASANIRRKPVSSRFVVDAVVQQDKVGPAINELMKEVRGIVTDRPITQQEFDTAKTAQLGQVATYYTDRYSVMGGLNDMLRYGRSNDYMGKASQRTRALTLADANAALRAQVDPSRLSWVITGNAELIRPQLDTLGLPVKTVKAADVLPPID